MKKVTIILLLMALLSCEKQNVEPSEIDPSINQELKTIESETTYPLIDIIGNNIDDVSRIELTYKYNGEEICYINGSVEDVYNFNFKIRNEKLLTRRHLPESIKIAIFDYKDKLVLRFDFGFIYTGNYKNDIIEKYYSAYPVDFVSPLTEVVIDSVYTLAQFSGSYEFPLPISSVRIEFYDSKLNMTHKHDDIYYYEHQFPFVRFNVNDFELNEYDITYVKFNYIHLIEDIDEFIVVSQSVITIE